MANKYHMSSQDCPVDIKTFEKQGSICYRTNRWPRELFFEHCCDNNSSKIVEENFYNTDNKIYYYDIKVIDKHDITYYEKFLQRFKELDLNPPQKVIHISNDFVLKKIVDENGPRFDSVLTAPPWLQISFYDIIDRLCTTDVDTTLTSDLMLVISAKVDTKLTADQLSEMEKAVSYIKKYENVIWFSFQQELYNTNPKNTINATHFNNQDKWDQSYWPETTRLFQFRS